MKYLYLIAIFLLGIYKAELQEPDVPDEREVALTDEDFENGNNLVLEVPDENEPFPLTDDIIEDGSMTEFAKRAVVSDRSKLWPNARVPYTVDWTWLRHEKAVIARAIKEFNDSTCVKWIPRTNETDYVFFDEAMNCSSFIGKKGGRQKIFIHPGRCIRVSSILHEMMHAIGFAHEHTRPDRDLHIEILYENLLEDNRTRKNFGIMADVVSLGDYDFNSLMHYPPWASSSNGNPTIRAKNFTGNIGRRATFSQLDIQKMALLYQCDQAAST